MARPFVVPVAVLASAYFRDAVRLAHRLGLQPLVLVRGKGGFADAVVSGAVETASEVGLEYRVVPFDDWSSMEPTGALMIVGTFAEDESAVTRIRGGH